MSLRDQLHNLDIDSLARTDDLGVQGGFQEYVPRLRLIHRILLEMYDAAEWLNFQEIEEKINNYASGFLGVVKQIVEFQPDREDSNSKRNSIGTAINSYTKKLLRDSSHVDSVDFYVDYLMLTKLSELSEPQYLEGVKETYADYNDRMAALLETLEVTAARTASEEYSVIFAEQARKHDFSVRDIFKAEKEEYKRQTEKEVSSQPAENEEPKTNRIFFPVWKWLQLTSHFCSSLWTKLGTAQIHFIAGSICMGGVLYLLFFPFNPSTIAEAIQTRTIDKAVSDSSWNTVSVVLPILLQKIVVLSLMLFMVKFFFSQFRIHKHLGTTNAHRRDSLDSLKLFIEAVGSEDVETKNLLVVEVARAIYELNGTGFLQQTDQDFGKVTLSDLVKLMAKSKGN